MLNLTAETYHRFSVTNSSSLWYRQAASAGFLKLLLKHSASSHTEKRMLEGICLKSALVSLIFYFPTSKEIKLISLNASYVEVEKF